MIVVDFSGIQEKSTTIMVRRYAVAREGARWSGGRGWW
jgi:hypothetical protein